MPHFASTSPIARPAQALARVRVAAAASYFYGYWFSHGLA
ncbi:hypothetical protein THL1_747 [Pseudomonas sp. TCU-HL1]|nr:hypothetical protein THL1_747 [Pseudomonas sp. TCU-HL1]